jgi:hypothetical protein
MNNIVFSKDLFHTLYLYICHLQFVFAKKKTSSIHLNKKKCPSSVTRLNLSHTKKLNEDIKLNPKFCDLLSNQAIFYSHRIPWAPTPCHSSTQALLCQRFQFPYVGE